jgi:hypothetical protein
MLIRTRIIAAVAVIGAALLSATPPSTAEPSTPRSAPAASAGHVPTVVVHMSESAIHLSVGHRLHAGRVLFRVRTHDGGHDLQLARLHTGYTLSDAERDFGKAFQDGDVHAIRRLDDNITFLGGASTRPGHPGAFAVNLHAARLLVFDQDSNALTRLRVFGTPPHRPIVAASSQVTAFSYGFGVSRQTLPPSGWTRVRNISDQPHFVVLQRVKNRTTHRMVARFIKSGAHGNPSWGLKAHTSVGVMSPNRGEVFHYTLPAGKYLMACFWPDDDTGMPHIYMGMWRLIRLR